MKLFRGIVVPMLTPLTAAGEIDRPALARYVAFLLDNGVDALFALSSTGEFCALPWDRQCEMAAATVEAVNGRAPVCAGVSTQCLQESAERARQMSRLGVDGVVALPPFYFRTSQAEMAAFFSALADASPAPLLVYNMPFRTQHNLEIETVMKLREHGNIVGLKDSVVDRERTRALASELRLDPRFSYLHGNELLTLDAAAHGADGCVASLANLAPRFFADAFARAAAGDVRPDDEAEIAALMPAFGLFEARPQDSTTLRLMAIKAILKSMGILEAHMAQLAPPLAPAQFERARAFAIERGLLAAPALP